MPNTYRISRGQLLPPVARLHLDENEQASTLRRGLNPAPPVEGRLNCITDHSGSIARLSSHAILERPAAQRSAELGRLVEGRTDDVLIGYVPPISVNTTSPGSCPACSHALEQHDRDFRFRLPDEFSDLTPDEVEARLSGDDRFLRVDENRYFIRSILSVQLSGGHEIAYGVWLESDLETLRRLYEVWDDPAYAATTVEGTLANDLPPWPGVAVGAPVRARPRRMDELPYLVESSDDTVAEILNRAWDHDPILTTFVN